LDCQLLANLLRINQIPLAYVPPPELQQLRELERIHFKGGGSRNGGCSSGIRSL